MKYTIGIDLGGTTMTAGLVDEDYNIVGKITRPTRLPRPAQDLEQALADLCRAVAKDCKIDFADVSYVGIGTPGSVNFTTGFVGYNTNFGYYDWNLGPDLEALLGCKVYVENDANAAAFGEYIAGGAKGFKDAVVITLGTGIGSGIILGGKILRGFNFAAGEMGHTVIVKGGRKCNCGRYGCWERYASSRALSEDAREAMTRHPESMMWKLAGDIDHVNAKIPFDAMEAGDATAKAVVDNWIEYVACGISNVVNTFEPEAICIGGGVSNQGETLLAPAGMMLSALCNTAQKESLAGLEFAFGIPGTVGGAVYMNAGAYGGEIKDVLTAVTFLDENLHLQTLPVQELQLGYRTSIFERCSWCILEAEFTLHPGDAQEIRTAMQEYMRRRKEKQPLEYPSAGSTFKRPVGQFAGKLIEDCGLRGFRVGGAAISEKHCGFVVNLGNATCADVVSLTEQVRQIVLEKTGCTLEREIRVVE